MALARARAVYGSAQGADKARGDPRRRSCARPRDAAKIVADAAAMRGDMAQHKPPAGPLDIKRGPGGLIDLEFAVHVLQLTNGVGLRPPAGRAIAALAAAGLDAARTSAARNDLLTRMLVTMRLVAPEGSEHRRRNRAQLVAEVCGHEDWDALLAAHDEARQSIAKLWTGVKGETG